MRETEKRAREAYVERFGGEPEVVASAPGRVNLIGEHTDYNGGFVLPCAIDRRIAVAAGPDGGEAALLRRLRRGPPAGAAEDDSWAKYPRGVAWALGEAGYDAGGFQAALAGDVPRASGLSSSAAIEAATALALDALFGLRPGQEKTSPGSASAPRTSTSASRAASWTSTPPSSARRAPPCL